MPTFEAVVVGSDLPPLTKPSDRMALVKYAAGSGDFNPLHYDPDFPQAREIGDNIVHGRLKHAALGQLVAQWLEHRGRIVELSCEFRGMDLRGAPYTCHGRVVAKDAARRTVELELHVADAHGRVTTPGRAVVAFDR